MSCWLLMLRICKATWKSSITGLVSLHLLNTMFTWIYTYSWKRYMCDCSMLSMDHNWIFCFFYSRTFLSIIGGVVAGILGFTGLKGFVFYALLMAFTSLGLIAKAKFSIHTYFDSWNRVLIDGFLGGLMVGCLCLLHLYFVIICVLETLRFMNEEISLDKIGRLE
jgi:hypothetical protein